MAKNIKARSADYSQWYLDVIKAAQLADYAPVKGCMVIRPEGYAIWEAIQRELDRRFKETGHVNAYFPLLIPQSFLTREAEHVEGFAMECAIVTHTRLEKQPDGQLKPASPLDEPLIIRPTSETVIGNMYSQWVQSYRDLPLLVNQWCNVMRWEMRTRLFLRTAEFLWAGRPHRPRDGRRSPGRNPPDARRLRRLRPERPRPSPSSRAPRPTARSSPGAVTTYCIEALMQDGKALQAGTSHNLGQNFAKAFDIKFLGRDQKQQLAHTTSWGVSTRLIGALIMAHSDDEGLILPPRVAPNVVAIVPIFRGEEEMAKVREYVMKLLTALVGEDEIKAAAKRARRGEIESFFFDKVTNQSIVVDWRDARPGDKQYHWEQRGVPFRIEVGPRDVDASAMVLKKRLDRSKEIVNLADVSSAWLQAKLDAVQGEMYQKALAYRDSNTRSASTYEEMKAILAKDGGFVRCFFKPDRANEAKIKDETKATVRCIPFDQQGKTGKCIFTGEETTTEVLFAVAY